MILALLGGISGIIRMVAGAAIAAVLAYAVTYLIIVPLERSDARRGYVVLAEKVAAEAEAAELRRQRDAASVALEEHRKRLAVAEAAEEQANGRLEKEIAENEIALDAAGRSCRAGSDDIEWLRRP